MNRNSSLALKLDVDSENVLYPKKFFGDEARDRYFRNMYPGDENLTIFEITPSEGGGDIIMTDRENELSDKLLDQRFKNIEDKFEIIVTKIDGVSSEMKEVKTANRQSFWAMIAVVFSVLIGFTSLIIALIRLLVFKQ